jgi:hypothetical protein
VLSCSVGKTFDWAFFLRLMIFFNLNVRFCLLGRFRM